MFDPKDIDRVSDEDWDDFKKQASQDELFYTGPGDLLDTPEGREKFCRLNETGVFNKPDPEFPSHKIWVFNLQGRSIMIKKRSRVDPALMETVEYDAQGNQLSKSYEPA